MYQKNEEIPKSSPSGSDSSNVKFWEQLRVDTGGVGKYAPSTTAPSDPSGYERAVGDRQCGDPGSKRRRLSDPPEHYCQEDSETQTDSEVVVRSCIAVFARTLSIRLARAMIELVGIEPNPGPKKDKGSKSKVSMSKAVVVYTGNQMGKKQQNVTRLQTSVRRSGGQLNVSNSDYSMYRCVLSNPFDCVPVRLGGETMQPTGLATLTWRGQIATSAAGNLSLVFYPWAASPLLGSTSAASNYTYTVISGPYPGSSSLAGLAPNARVVASALRVCTTTSATNNQGIVTIGSLPRSAVGSGTNLTIDGFPTGAATAATQGFNEFFNYLQTESYPLKDGASAFWKPEDPLDFTFRDILVTGISNIGPQEDISPFIVVGVTGAQASSNLLVELITHLEYTVTTGTTGVVDTGYGRMSQQGLIDSVKSVFSGAIDSTISGVVGGLDLKAGLTRGGSRLLQAGARYLTDAAGNYFSNSNNVVSQRLLK
jgi:hypothetical protein